MFKPELYIKVAADSIQQLRRCDVFRLIDGASSGAAATSVANYIIRNRPDLRGEVDDCLNERANDG